MLVIAGSHNAALCFTSELEPVAAAQIQELCDRPEFANCKIRVMPDVHPGKGCAIGSTMTISDKVVPYMVGVDIGCGMETVELDERLIDFPALDEVIRRYVPCGFNVRSSPHPFIKEIDLESLFCFPHISFKRASLSLGTLGGGNHFIEVSRSAATGRLFLVIHSGSRRLGTEAADYYQTLARQTLQGRAPKQIAALIRTLKDEGRHAEINEAVKRLKAASAACDSPKEAAYLTGEPFHQYLHDMKIIQRFAYLNRQAMADVILDHLNIAPLARFSTVHNYIDTDSMILRKGAVSAKKDEKLIIPINMRDGSLLCLGLGADDWNQSAPHGAGRLMSRKAAFKNLSLNDFAAQMDGVYSTSVNRETLDEAPMAYKSIDEIVRHIGPAVKIIDRLKAVYNFKAAETSYSISK